MMDTLNSWVVAALIIVGILAMVAGYYLILLKQQADKQKLASIEREIELKQRRLRAQKSIRVLCQATLEGNVTYTETSIRVSGLLQLFQLSEKEQEQHQGFSALANATSHIPILDEWKKLSNKKKRELDKERERIEKDYEDFILDACRTIAQDQHYLSSYL